jgi:hypothetical protein
MKDKHPTILITSLAILIAGAALYLNTSSPSDPTPPAGAPPSQKSEKTDTDSPAGFTAASPDQKRTVSVRRNEPDAHPVDPALIAHPPTAATYSTFLQKPQWEQEVIKLANRLDMKDDDKAVALLNKVYTLPDEPAKVVAMEHATRLMSDQQFQQMKGQILSLGFSEDMRETILRDILTRADSVRFPALVDLLRQPPNPGQQEIREVLEAYLDVDYGMDVQKWDTAVRQWLIENPED